MLVGVIFLAASCSKIGFICTDWLWFTQVSSRFLFLLSIPLDLLVVYLLIGSILGRFVRKLVVAWIACLCFLSAVYHLVVILIGYDSSCRCFGSLDLSSFVMLSVNCTCVVLLLMAYFLDRRLDQQFVVFQWIKKTIFPSPTFVVWSLILLTSVFVVFRTQEG